MSNCWNRLPDRNGLYATKQTKALKLGPDVLPMWVADMDYSVADPIIHALEHRAASGVLGYMDRHQHFYQVIKDWLGRRHGINLETSDILLSTGVIHSMHSALRAFTNAGDAVLTFVPIYHPFYSVIGENDRICVFASAGETPDLEAMQHQVLEKQVRCILLCNPYNPLGWCWKEDQLRSLVDFCVHHGIYIISDEIHADIVYSDGAHTSLLQIPGAEEIGVVCMSPCKTFNIAGMKVSYILAPNPKLRETVESELHRSCVHSVNTMGLVAMEAAYTQAEEWLDGTLRYLEGNRDFIAEFLQRELPEIGFTKPEATYLAWLDMSAISTGNAAKFLLDEARILVNDGCEFHHNCHDYIRLNFATSREVLEEALSRIKQIIKERRELL